MFPVFLLSLHCSAFSVWLNATLWIFKWSVLKSGVDVQILIQGFCFWTLGWAVLFCPSGVYLPVEILTWFDETRKAFCNDASSTHNSVKLHKNAITGHWLPWRNVITQHWVLWEKVARGFPSVLGKALTNWKVTCSKQYSFASGFLCVCFVLLLPLLIFIYFTLAMYCMMAALGARSEWIEIQRCGTARARDVCVCLMLQPKVMYRFPSINCWLVVWLCVCVFIDDLQFVVCVCLLMTCSLSCVCVCVYWWLVVCRVCLLMTCSLSCVCVCVSASSSKCVILSANKTQHHMNVLHTVTRKHKIVSVYLIGVSNSEI